MTYMDEDRFPKKELYRTSPVLVSLTPQEADKLPQTMEVGMSLQPAGAIDVQIRLGRKEYRKRFEKLPAVLPTDEGTVAFSQTMIPCHRSVWRALQKNVILRLISTGLFPWRKDTRALCQ